MNHRNPSVESLEAELFAFKGQQRAEFARQSQALAEALDEFKTDLDFAHILPSEEWTDARARAWRGFLLRLENSGLPDFVVSSAALMDQEVRP